MKCPVYRHLQQSMMTDDECPICMEDGTKNDGKRNQIHCLCCVYVICSSCYRHLRSKKCPYCRSWYPQRYAERYAERYAQRIPIRQRLRHTVRTVLQEIYWICDDRHLVVSLIIFAFLFGAMIETIHRIIRLQNRL